MWSQRFLEQRRHINRYLLRRITVMVDKIFGRLHQMSRLEKMEIRRVTEEKNMDFKRHFWVRTDRFDNQFDFVDQRKIPKTDEVSTLSNCANDNTTNQRNDDVRKKMETRYYKSLFQRQWKLHMKINLCRKNWNYKCEKQLGDY